ncbi:MAG TPA: alpha/beta hydrolase-fold protein [Kiritimatiellia bacterium]|nr:alpha/beta hydrolase-fold protein [Kiritimatiellia bacterium]
MRTFCWVACLWLGWAGGGLAWHLDREVVGISVVWDVGLGTNVHVVGNHPDLGDWSPERSVKLRWTSGNVWTGQVAVEKGTALEYKFISRSGAPGISCEGANVVWEPGPNRTRFVESGSPPPSPGKTVYYYSGWTSAVLVTVTATGFPVYPMVAVGPGRTPGETLFKAEQVGVAGEDLEFVPNGWLNGTNYWDNSPEPDFGGNYRTRLDAFLLQDGDVFGYWPSNSVSAPRFEERFVNSSHPPIDGRAIRIWLPRGYDSHPWKRYPVMYFQDGQNLYHGADAFGNGAWDADLTSRREISQGRMREIILVAIDNFPERRRWEYNPLGDTYPGEAAGRADAYLRFLVDNVRPTLDFHYRTLNDRRNTLVGGSSMGGIFSIYAGFETNVFGGVLAMSPAFTRAPNYSASLAGRPKGPWRVYMDTGNNEGQVGPHPGGNYWEAPWDGYDRLLGQGYAPNLDLLMRVGCGHVHNEAAWRARLPEAMRFLLPVGDEPNRIALGEWPPDLELAQESSSIAFATQGRWRYYVERGLPGAWQSVGDAVVEAQRWGVAHVPAPLTNGPSAWLRVVTEPAD